MVRYMGTESVSADEVKRVHTRGTPSVIFDPGARCKVRVYLFEKRRYVVTERVNIRGSKIITAQRGGR